MILPSPRFARVDVDRNQRLSFINHQRGSGFQPNLPPQGALNLPIHPGGFEKRFRRQMPLYLPERPLGNRADHIPHAPFCILVVDQNLVDFLG